MNILSIDLGFGWTKAKYGSCNWCQPSILGEPSQLFEESKRTGDLIYNNQYFVGNLAVRQSEVKFQSIKDNKAETWITEVLLKSALGCLNPRGSFNLVSGLPIDFYFNQRDSFSNLLSQINHSDYYEVEIIGKIKQIAKPTIRQHKIVPQPLGTAMDYLLDNEGNLYRTDEAKKRILVIDLGFYTLDLLVLDSMEINKSSCSPVGLGVDTAYKLLRQHIKDKLRKTPARYEMDQIVLSKEYEGVNVSPLIENAFKSLAIQIQNEIESLNMDFNTCVLTGGASSFIEQYLSLNNLHVVKKPQLANVRGYEKIGVRIWGTK